MTEVQSVKASKLSSLTGSWQIGSCWQEVEFMSQFLEKYLLPELCLGVFLCDAVRGEELHSRKIACPPEGQQVVKWAEREYLLQGFHMTFPPRKQGMLEQLWSSGVISFSSIPESCQYIARETWVWRHLQCWGVITVFLFLRKAQTFAKSSAVNFILVPFN